MDSQDNASRGAQDRPAEPTGDRETSFTRRALIQAGWTVPVIMAVAPPQTFAQSPGGHNDGHDDHADAPHGDTHQDIPG